MVTAREHLLAGGLEDERGGLRRTTSASGRQGSTLAAKQASLLKMLPMPAVRRWSRRASPRVRDRVGGAELGDDLVEVEVRGEDVGPEASELRVDRDAARAQDAQGRPAELDRVGALAGEHRPGRGPRPAPALAARVDVPAAAHPQVAVQDEVAEVEEQVLAVGVDPRQGAAVEPFDPRRAAARVRRRDADRLPDQRVGEPVLRAQDRVALGHPLIITRSGARPPFRLVGCSRRRRRPDPLARAAVLGIAGGRIALGASAILATRPALKALGFEATDTSTRALARLAGGRDIAIGLLAFAARDDRAALREATAVAAAVDLGDAVCFAIAGRDPAAGRAAVQGILAGGAATAVGAWAVRRLA